MGCGSSSIAHVDFDDSRFLSVVNANMQHYTKLGLTTSDLSVLYGVFLALDTQNKGKMRAEELLDSILDHVGADETKYAKRVFQEFKKYGFEKVNFYCFVLLLYNFCTLDPSWLACFTFYLYDNNGNGQIEKGELENMMVEIYGNKLEGNTSAKRLYQYMSSNGGSQTISESYFLDFAKNNQALLYPASVLQTHIQQKVGGESFWMKIEKIRIGLTMHHYKHVTAMLGMKKVLLEQTSGDTHKPSPSASGDDGSRKRNEESEGKSPRGTKTSLSLTEHRISPRGGDKYSHYTQTEKKHDNSMHDHKSDHSYSIRGDHHPPDTSAHHHSTTRHTYVEHSVHNNHHGVNIEQHSTEHALKSPVVERHSPHNSTNNAYFEHGPHANRHREKIDPNHTDAAAREDSRHSPHTVERDGQSSNNNRRLYVEHSPHHHGHRAPSPKHGGEEKKSENMFNEKRSEHPSDHTNHHSSPQHREERHVVDLANLEGENGHVKKGKEKTGLPPKHESRKTVAGTGKSGENNLIATLKKSFSGREKKLIY